MQILWARGGLLAGMALWGLVALAPQEAFAQG